MPTRIPAVCVLLAVCVPSCMDAAESQPLPSSSQQILPRDAEACGTRFGDVDGYQLCGADAGACEFNATKKKAMSCSDVCASMDRACLAAFENGASDPCAAIGSAHCDDADRWDDICVCALDESSDTLGPPPAGTLLYSNDGETLAGLDLEYGQPNQISAVGGRIRTLVKSGEKLWTGSNGTQARAEAKLQLSPFEDRTYWFVYDMQVGPGHAGASDHSIVSQMHGQTGTSWPSPQATLRVYGDEIRFETAINHSPSDTERHTLGAFPYEEGDWMHVVIRAHFSQDLEGFYRVWVDGEEVLHAQNIRTIDHDKTSLFFKFGIYRMKDREMSFDNIEVYRE